MARIRRLLVPVVGISIDGAPVSPTHGNHAEPEDWYISEERVPSVLAGQEK